RAAAVHVLLEPGDFEVGVDHLVRLDEVALRLEPFQRQTQIAHLFGRGPGGLVGHHVHGWVPPLCGERGAWGRLRRMSVRPTVRSTSGAARTRTPIAPKW